MAFYHLAVSYCCWLYYLYRLLIVLSANWSINKQKLFFPLLTKMSKVHAACSKSGGDIITTLFKLFNLRVIIIMETCSV